MLTLNDLGNVDDGVSWQKLKNDVAVTYHESERLSKLTEIVLQGFINRLARESTGKMGKKMMIIEKKGTKRYPESGTLSSVEEEKEDYVIRKQKKQRKSDNGKKQKKKQKTNNNNKKHNKKKGQDPIVKFIALGLEPPPDMPEAFKNCIENLGGTEIKLVIQKFIQVTDLNESQNRLSMPVKQVRSEFSNEAEEEKLNKREAIEVVIIEPCLEVSKLNLNKWLIGQTSNSYVLNGPCYKNMVKNNGDSLKPMAVVQIWSFRVGPKSQLRFALIKVRDGEDGHMID